MRDMEPGEILSYLRAVWDPHMDEEYVSEGIEFLTKKDFVRIDGSIVRLKERGPNHKGRLVVRSDEDRDLAMLLTHWSP